MMNMLTNELNATTIVSIAHRPELEQFHNRKIVLERRRGGARLVTDIDLTSKPRRRRLLGRLRGRWRRKPRRNHARAA
jgi:putative ATP-binding cassette transporter